MRENCFKSEGECRSYDAVCNCLLNIDGIELEIFYRNQICRNEVFFCLFLCFRSWDALLNHNMGWILQSETSLMERLSPVLAFSWSPPVLYLIERGPLWWLPRLAPLVGSQVGLQMLQYILSIGNLKQKVRQEPEVVLSIKECLDEHRHFPKAHFTVIKTFLERRSRI